MRYYLAIDIGASSGRHVIGYMNNGEFCTEEVYRFENGMAEIDGELCWDTEKLTHEIISGMKACKDIGKIPYSISIDTWGVDYVLLDKNDVVLDKTYGYRDARTKNMDSVVESIIPQNELYERTGIQKQIYNTIYQLMSVKMDKPEVLNNAQSLLTIPCYLMYKVTGVKANEYTHATTTQMVNCESKDWDYDIIDRLGFPRHIFCNIKKPMDLLGELSEEIQKEVGYNSKVIMCATHDTASAVLAVPATSMDIVYISSGTWSLLGIESEFPIICNDAMEAKFTNEGGFNHRYRFLKNIMGLWMIQCVYHEYDEKYTYDQIAKFAEHANIDTIVDCEDERFFAPKSMIMEIKQFAKETNQKVPEDIGEFAAIIYNSLAYCYKEAIEQVERITGREFAQINVIGGGSKAEYLNKVTAQITNKTVIAGPAEATAIGNIACQMLANNEFKNVEQVRECIKKSFKVESIE